ncbi:hypothetical protein S7711_04469 [Stachybotrys chartarum IBT 7711]|uniref:Microbial-type PARG catalytic domain-containing protein n=1 Tax=Stachybotrys chartarum (strain CBS 109288 / IBT 7711) TaxID=1280523 RepID=A0A084BA50_STACB|nr:hypothetical protein S7711_04469 [Stachybotrys chartarum IBT 7711]KFA55417.1 hypothetical protein S40293_10005 [Stachybotrys chartarum IBT 40293]
MGRTEPSQGLAPPSFRRDARAKKAKATLNKVIPALLSAHPRARRGADSSELIVEPLARKVQHAETSSGKPGSSSPPANQGPSLVLQVADTLTAAHSLLRDATTGKLDLDNREARVAVLNMASPLSPGGGFVNGANSQEESLCMRSTLLSSLKDEFYRLPELGAVYTPDVLVFRDQDDDDLEKRQRWFVNCVSAASLRFPDTEADEDSGHGRYVNDKDRALVLQKMRVVMRIFQAKGARKVVLGAWGCGAYGNPIGEIATAWKKVLVPGKNRKEAWQGIEEVVFAIKDRGVADGFEQAFGKELTRREMEDPLKKENGDKNDTETLGMEELQDKIQELEHRMEQTKNDQVRTGLGKVLAGLKSQRGHSRSCSEQDTEDGEEALSDAQSGDETEPHNKHSI